MSCAARQRDGACRGSGFTLLEVMVALGILAGSLVAISDIVSGALRNHVRARQLEVATLLARGKMAELEDHFDAKGFGDFEQSEEGTFEEDGHADVHWKYEVVVPTVELGPDAVLSALTGDAESKLTDLITPQQDGGQGNAVAQAAMQVALQNVLTTFGEQIKKGVRELRLTVSWKEGAAEESFTVVTDLVNLTGGGP